jgi:hypothetical protein
VAARYLARFPTGPHRAAMEAIASR